MCRSRKVHTDCVSLGCVRLNQSCCSLYLFLAVYRLLCLGACLAPQSGMSEVSSYLNLTCAAAMSLGSRLEERLCEGQVEDRAVV